MKATPLTLMGHVLDALNEELERDGTREGLCEMMLLHGDQLLLDYGAESCGGMGWVRLISANATQRFPASADVNSCASDLAFAMEVGVVRPAPMPEVVAKNEVILPDGDDQVAATSLALEDMQAMLRALRQVEALVENFSLGDYAPTGPVGGVVGGSWAFTVGEELED